ncbi:LysR family transcriptional regulator [Bradyrhizobium prioriisuperbiae]|uniref:LysR family transcriptional regulator n=1 Tax=Bradyrhizobium prioriisuperbiae TaxID=2854389 RepID=UPI0028E29C31|nr:LysR family transcriptional regulator [Bradyrhizobium prioritasuperba]
MDYVRAINVFLRTVDGGSLTAAARKLGVSLASVSRELSALEAHLGCALFVRSTRSLALTEHGHLFQERARKIAGDIRDAELALRPVTLEASGHIRVTAPSLLGRHLLVPILPDFLKAHPKVQLDLTLRDRDPDWIEDGIDVGLHIGSLSDSALLDRKLGTIRIVTCAAPTYLRRHGSPDTPHQLRQHDCLVFAVDPNDLTWRYQLSANARTAVRVNVRFRANTLEAVVTAALAGVGLVRAPLWYVADHVKAGRLTLVLEKYERPASVVHALFPASRARLPAVRAFIDLLAARLVLKGDAKPDARKRGPVRRHQR